jgi:hypothetical protein
MDTAPFAAASRIAPTDRADVFAVEVSPNWTIAGKPNGGYLLAIMGRAAVAATAHDSVLAASAHYLSPPDVGFAEVVTTVLRAGRSASQVRAQLVQDDRLCVEALITTAPAPSTDTKPFWADGVPSFELAPFDECVRIPPVTPTGLSVPMLAEIDLRLDPAVLGFAVGRPSGAGELRGWLQIEPDRVADSFDLLFAVDAFPPATFEIEVSGWVPTFELTAYVRATPAPGPLRVLQKARLVDGQKVDEACFVEDSTGRLVAQATQLAGVRLG